MKETSKNNPVHVKEASNPYSHLSNLEPVVATALETQSIKGEDKPNLKDKEAEADPEKC